MNIRCGGLDDDAVIELLQQHLLEMAEHSPPESVHALDIEALKTTDISFFTGWSNEGALMGCGAVKALDAENGEVKSMRTAVSFRRQGVARTLLTHLIQLSRERRYRSLWLETGSLDVFRPAREMYRRHGFVECTPFGDYLPDPNSVFMRLKL